MAKGKQIYEGKAKILYEGPEKGTLIQYFKDDATAFNNKKKAIIDNKELAEAKALGLRVAEVARRFKAGSAQ